MAYGDLQPSDALSFPVQLSCGDIVTVEFTAYLIVLSPMYVSTSTCLVFTSLLKHSSTFPSICLLLQLLSTCSSRFYIFNHCTNKVLIVNKL